MLRDTLETLRTHYPRVQLQVMTGSGHQRVEQVHDVELDAAVGASLAQSKASIAPTVRSTRGTLDNGAPELCGTRSSRRRSTHTCAPCATLSFSVSK